MARRRSVWGGWIAMLRENIENHLSQLMAYAMVLTRDRHDAQDLVHDCVVKALSTLRRPLPPRTGRSDPRCP